MNIEQTFKTEPRKLKKIRVLPSPQLDIKTTESATKVEKIPEKGEEVSPLVDVREISTPDGISGRESILEVDERQTQWSKIENGCHRNSPSTKLPHRRRCCPDEACMMRVLVTLAFIFSLTNLCLTLMILFARGQNKSCACQEKIRGLGRQLTCMIPLHRAGEYDEKKSVNVK